MLNSNNEKTNFNTNDAQRKKSNGEGLRKINFDRQQFELREKKIDTFNQKKFKAQGLIDFMKETEGYEDSGKDYENKLQQINERYPNLLSIDNLNLDQATSEMNELHSCLQELAIRGITGEQTDTLNPDKWSRLPDDSIDSSLSDLNPPAPETLEEVEYWRRRSGGEVAIYNGPGKLRRKLRPTDQTIGMTEK